MLIIKNGQQISKKVATAIIKCNNNLFLLQLRDSLPQISFPGHWSSFGGKIEENETPNQAILRELKEEINFIPKDILPFKTFELREEKALVFCYLSKITVPLNTLYLMEGRDFDLFSSKEIRKGFLLSKKLNKLYPITPLFMKMHNEVIQIFR